MSESTSRIEEVIDTVEDDPGLSGDASDSSSGSEESEDENQASTSAAPKKKTKARRMLNAMRGKDEIPQELVDEVLAQVKKEHGENAEGADEGTVRAALEEMKVMDMVKGKAGIGGKNKKDMASHKFWGSQPVPQLGEGPPEEDGYIEPPERPKDVRQDAYPLPKDFEWVVMDLSEANQLHEVYTLLSMHYVEDDDATFRFQYTAEFLQWALMPPGYHKDWHIGVRVKSNKKLVAFISGVPMTLRVRNHVFNASEINYLCVHKKLRGKRLAPVLIKEVTRQCHLKGIFQAIYTGGVILPTPVSTCQYWHRSLNIPKLVEVGFTHVPRNMTLARMIRLNKLPATFQCAGLREMKESDVDQVSDLYEKYMQRFDMVPEMTKDEVRHQFLSGLGRGERRKLDGRREGQVIWTYVVEYPETDKITDFFSFYSLPSTIIKNPKHSLLEAAYLFYYASDVAFEDKADEDDKLKKRLEALLGDALTVADQAKFDVLNALTLMDNVDQLKGLKFGAGDGMLNFYLYNWRTTPLAGAKPEGERPAGRGVGVVML